MSNIDNERIKKYLGSVEERINFNKENGCKLLDCKVIDENIKLRQENIKLRKIAEKLAGYGFNCYYGSPLKFDSPEELIEIARKETEDEELARNEVESGK